MVPLNFIWSVNVVENIYNTKTVCRPDLNSQTIDAPLNPELKVKIYCYII